MYCLGFSIAKDVMVESFMAFVSQQEEDLIKDSLKEDVSEDFLDSKEFSELLENFKVRTRVSK